MSNFFLNKRANPNYNCRKFEFSIMLEFSLYVGCSIGCDYCPQNELNKKCSTKYMSFEDYKKYLSTVPKNNVYLVYAGFCEPLLYDDLENVVKYSYDNGYNILCASTLPTLNENNVELFLTEKYWKGRTVHLKDSHMNQKHFGDKYYEFLSRYLKQVRDQSDKTKEYKFSFLAENLDEKILAILKEYNLEEMLSPLTPYQRIDAPVKSKNIITPEYKSGRIYCSENFYRKQMVVPGGDVVMCCMDVQKKHILGNLSSMSYNDIHKGEEYKKIMKGFNDESLNTICRKCIYAKQA